MRNYRNLTVWQKSHQATLTVYRITQNFPREELFGLVSQTRRTALSIPSNIAEGSGRNSDPDFARFLQIAAGSSINSTLHRPNRITLPKADR
jgi:four helix bundle protein